MLLRLVQRGAEKDFPSTAEGCRAVQDFFGDLGVDKNGWRVLATHGRAIIERGLRFKDVHQALGVIALQARLLHDFRNELPQPELIDTLLANLHLLPRMDDLDIPHRLLELADAACIAARNEGRLEAFLDEEWLSVIAWLVEAAPMIHRNQCAQGWGCILRAKSRWAMQELARHSSPEWAAYPTPLAFPKFEVLELDSKAKLSVEGVEMAHCVASYADQCAEGKTRVFSVRRKGDGRRVATVACGREGAEWIVEEVQGRANSDPGVEVEALGTEIALACSMGPAASPRLTR